MPYSTIKINLSAYLVDFAISCLGGTAQPVRARRDTYIGSLLYRMLEKVPENCLFKEPILSGKRILEIQIGWIGSNGEERKQPFTHYYLPLSKQREFESALRDLFDELFFHAIEIGREYSDAQYVDLIDSFCRRYNIDFARNFDALKKKHYRARIKFVQKQTK